MFEYEISGLGTIHIYREGKPELIITLSNFWSWVVKNDFNAYSVDFQDPSQSDGHGQNTGHFDMDEYLDKTNFVREDLERYLKEKNL